MADLAAGTANNFFYDRMPTGLGKKLSEVDGKVRINRERKGKFVCNVQEAAAASAADVVAMLINDGAARRM